ncbi:hypothetical protein [Microvirga yunnanensis]|uniref:hypothetical protein n=1 Tax=Microvirga yunnanensis TaxID=2953740 RepID=UPI0021C8FE3B|nr:hypothetical protein [Microvirga sp. HBU65207]
MSRFLVAACSVAFLAPTLALGQDTGVRNWTFGYLQGFAEHTIREDRDSLFRITCDVSASDKAAETKYGLLIGIDIEIHGREPPENGTVLISIDDKKFKFSTDESRAIGTLDHIAQSRYYAMWKAMIKGRAMRVTFSDGRSSPFSLSGARKVLGPNPCEAAVLESPL